MSVHVLYRSNHGNNIFQYLYARLFAEHFHLMMETPFKRPELITMIPEQPGKRVATPTVTVTDKDMGFLFKGDRREARFVFDGYFQCSSWYHKKRARIMQIAYPRGTPPNLPEEDLVINLRIGKDYRQLGWRIHPEWYLDILKKVQFGRLHIVTDHRDEDYLRCFSPYNPIVVSEGPEGDWAYLRGAKTLVCANSTFSWWAAYFSNAITIYTFKPWVKHATPKIGPFPNGIEVDGQFEY